MEAFDSVVVDYEKLPTAIEKLNYFRNLHYTDGDNTENGVISNAVNEILPEYVRLKSMSPTDIINKARKVLKKDYDYIISEPAEIKHIEQDGQIVLQYVEFISDSNYQDRIRIFNNGIYLFEEEGPRYELLKFNSFKQFVDMDSPQIAKHSY